MSISEHPRNGNSFFGFRMISSLQSLPYRIYFFGTLGFFAAMSMNIVTSPLLIYRLTGSYALLGTMSLVSSIPLIFMSLFGGAIADRFQKKQIMLVSLVFFAAISLGIALALDTGRLSRDIPGSWWILLVSSFVQGSLMGILMPAFQAVIPEIVRREHLMNAIALNILGMSSLSLIAPGLAGVIIDTFDFQAVYYVMAGLYIYTAVFILFIRYTSRMTARTGKIMSDIRDGFIYMRNNPVIWSLLVFTTAFVVLSMPYQQLMPIFTDNILKVGATGLGVLMSIAGGGALAGSLIMAALPDKKRGLILIFSGLVAGIALIIFAFSGQWITSMAVMVFLGLAQTFRNTIGSALIQVSTEPVYMGRVMSLLNIQWGLMAIATFIAGVAAEVVPVQWVVGTLAIGLVIVSIFFTGFSHRIKGLD